MAIRKKPCEVGGFTDCKTPWLFGFIHIPNRNDISEESVDLFRVTPGS